MTELTRCPECRLSVHVDQGKVAEHTRPARTFIRADVQRWLEAGEVPREPCPGSGKPAHR